MPDDDRPVHDPQPDAGGAAPPAGRVVSLSAPAMTRKSTARLAKRQPPDSGNANERIRIKPGGRYRQKSLNGGALSCVYLVVC
jgi:hypothetical protein